MGRKSKQYTIEERIKRLEFRGRNQELKGQTKLRHYHDTKDKMISCSICAIVGAKLHRHRIVPGTEYTNANVVIVCVKCHKLIHKILNELGGHDYLFNCRLAIEFAKHEIRNKR